MGVNFTKTFVFTIPELGIRGKLVSHGPVRLSERLKPDGALTATGVVRLLP